MTHSDSRQGVSSPAWEQLVTEGHVVAARLRSSIFWARAIGVILLLAGSFGFLYLASPKYESREDISFFLQKQIRDYKRDALEKIGNIRSQRALPRDEAKNVITSSQLANLVEQTLASLNESGDLPQNASFEPASGESKEFPIAKIKPEEFWGFQWNSNGRSANTIFSVEKRHIVALGSFVNVGDENNPMLERWVGLFKKTDDRFWGLLNQISDDFKGEWVFASLNMDSLITIKSLPAVAPENIPVSLKKLSKE